MKIAEVKPEHYTSYDRICNIYGSVFMSRSWLNTRRSAKLYGVFNDSGVLVAAFALRVVRRFGLLFLTDCDLTPSTGFFNAEAIHSQVMVEIKKKIIFAISDFIASLRPFFVSITWCEEFRDMQPFIWKNYHCALQYTYILNIVPDESVLFEQIDNNRRQVIKRTCRDGIEIKLTSNNEDLKMFVFNTFKRKKINVDINSIQQVFDHFMLPGNSFSYFAYFNNLPVAMAFCIYDSCTCYYLFGGYDETSKHKSTGAACLWECVKHARKLGLKKFDFEGSMVPSIEKYFRSFGGELHYNFRVLHAPFFVECILKFFKPHLF